MNFGAVNCGAEWQEEQLYPTVSAVLDRDNVGTAIH